MLYGNVIFIKKNGGDGSKFPVTRKSLKIGRTEECVIRIQNPNVSPQHCHLTIDKNGQAKLRNLSKHTPTFLNDVPLGKGDHLLRQGDMIKIGDRCARWEYNPSSKYLNPEHSELVESHVNPLQKRKSEGAVAGVSKPKRVDKRRYSEVGASIGGLGSLGKTLKISLGSTKLVARHSLELQKLGLCPQVRIKRCSILASHVPAVAHRNGTPVRETWEVKSVPTDEKGKSSPKEGTGRKDTPIKKPLGGQSTSRNPCQAPNLQSIPEDSPLTRKTSLERIRLDDVPECTTPSGSTKPSVGALTSSSKKRARPSKASTPGSEVLSTPVEKKKVKTPSLPDSRNSVKNVKGSKTEKTPENRGSKRKLSATATAERAAKKLKTIKPAKPDKNKKAALLVLGKASRNKNSLWKYNINMKQPGKYKKAVTKQSSVKYKNIRKKSKPEGKSLKPSQSSIKKESPGKRKEKGTPSGPAKSRDSKVLGTGKSSHGKDVTDVTPGKSKKAVVVLQDLGKTGRISCSSERSTPKKRVRDNIVTSASTSKIIKKKVGFSDRGSRSSSRSQLDVSTGSGFDLNETRTLDVTLDRFVSPLSSTKSPKGSLPKVRKLEDSGVKDAQKEKETRGEKTGKKDSTNIKGVRRLLLTPKQRKSPKNDLTDVRGVRKLMESPRQRKSPRNDLTDVKGVRRLMGTPKQQKSPKNDLTDVRGVRKLMETPKERKSPKNDLTDVRGVRRLLRTPREPKGPKNDLTDVRGVRKLMESAKKRKSPRNDLTDVRGVRRLMGTPKQQKSPKNDLTDVRGVRKLMASPRQRKSPRNDLTDVEGVSKLFSSIEDSGKADVSVPGAGEAVASAVESGITRKRTRRTTKTVPAETEKEAPIVRRSTRRTRASHIEEKVEEIKKGKPEGKVTKKAAEKVLKKEKVKETETVTRIVTRSASKTIGKRGAGKK